MIKRPFIWLFGAYLAGLISAWYGLPRFLLILLGLFAFLLIYLLLYRIKVSWISKRDGFLWALPFLLFLAYLTMSQRLTLPEADQAFEAKADCSLTGEVTMIVERTSGRSIYTKNNLVSFPGGKTYPVDNLMIYTSDDNSYLVGNKLQVYGQILKFSKPTNPGQFDEELYYKIQRVDYKVKAEKIIITDSGYSRLHALLGKLRQKLYSVYTTILPEREAGVITAMLLGEKYLLEEELKSLYQDSGITHILAISGLHVTLIGYSLYRLLRKCKTGLIPSVTVSILFIYCYGLMTNFSVSTNRAVVMFAVMLIAKIIGKTYDSLSAMALCAFLILLNNPLQIFSAGFLLSFCAILGITLLVPALQKLFPYKSPIFLGLLSSLSAQLMTLPLILYFFYQLPVYSIIINLLILPAMMVLMLSAITAGIAGIICMPLGVFLIGGANMILRYIEGVCRLGSSLPGNLYTTGKPDTIRVLLYILLLAGFLWTAERYQRKELILLPLLAVTLLLLPKRGQELSITMLDVGQGEAIVIRSETGRTYLLDGGSSDVWLVGKNRLQPFLLSSGEDCIDYALVTHADTDHISGLRELMEGGRIKIKHLVLPGIEILSRNRMEMPDTSDKASAKGQNSRSNQASQLGISKKRLASEEAYLELEQEAIDAGIKILYMNTGDFLMDGNLRLECLHPAEDYAFGSSNSYSTVISLSYGDFNMLLTGDLEADGEKLVTERLLSQSIASGDGSGTDYDVLKVAHHGSKNSTLDHFLRLIKPEYALISCSKNNRYGHPHKELLERLALVDCQVETTYETGALTIKTDGEKLKIVRYLKQWKISNF